MRFRALFFLSFFISIFCVGQEDEFKWWERKHNWDGFTPWDDYFIVSPRYFGPNALPIPALNSATLADSASITLNLRDQRTNGDVTQDLFFSLLVPMGDRINLEGYAVAAERYQMDTVKRDERFARDQDAKGLIAGDVYLATHIGVIQNHEKLPDLTLRIGLRTASGRHLRNARYLDSPGYFFDLRTSKLLWTNAKSKFIVNGLVGFHAWQTNKTNHQQNDAVMYGIGITYDRDLFQFQADLSGYDGYINNGDHSQALRLFATLKRPRLNYFLNASFGSIDNLYNMYGMGITWKARKKTL